MILLMKSRVGTKLTKDIIKGIKISSLDEFL